MSCVDCPNRPDATELWVVAQLLPDEGIEDGVRRIEELLGETINAI